MVILFLLHADLEQLLGEGSLEHMFASNASQMRSLHVAEEDDGSGQPCKLPRAPAPSPSNRTPYCCSFECNGESCGSEACTRARLPCSCLMPDQGVTCKMCWAIALR